MQPLESMDNELDALVTPLSHLNSVCNNQQVRDVYNQCIPILTEFSTVCGQNKALCDTTDLLNQQSDSLDQAQQKSLEHSLRGFKLSGVNLEEKQKKAKEET